MSMNPTTPPPSCGNSAPTSFATDEVQKALIAQAIWTDVHWLMPKERTVTVTVSGDRIDVALDDSDRTA